MLYRVSHEFPVGRDFGPPNLDAGVRGGHSLEAGRGPHQVLVGGEHHVLAVGARALVGARPNLRQEGNRGGLGDDQKKKN